MYILVHLQIHMYPRFHLNLRAFIHVRTHVCVHVQGGEDS